MHHAGSAGGTVRGRRGGASASPAPRPTAALDFGAMSARRISAKAERFTESVIREMNRLAVSDGAVSLAQGFPDFACPPELKRAVAEAVDADINQYAITWGSKPLRDAIAETTAAPLPGLGRHRSRRPRSPSPAARPRR